MSNTERMATYVTGLTYPKPKQQHVQHPVACHLILLKQKIASSPPMKSDFVVQRTSESPLSYHKSLNHSPHSYHKENPQAQQSPPGFS